MKELNVESLVRTLNNMFNIEDLLKMEKLKNYLESIKGILYDDMVSEIILKL